MPVASCLTYVKGLLDGLPMPPGTGGNMAAYILPPDPDEETQVPTAYVWPSQWKETRDPKTGGTVPRNTGWDTPSGTKSIVHTLDVYLTWFQPNETPDPRSDSLFPGIVDAVCVALRTAPTQVPVTDPYTGQPSTLVNIGEVIDGKTGLVAVSDEVWNRLDSLLTVTVWEIFRA